MMAWSIRRRLLYLLSLVLAIAALGASGYWVWKPAPSCFDGRQNQDETGVDCGGACAAVCPAEIRPLKEVWTTVLESNTGVYDAASFVINPNRSYLARRATFAVRVFDAADSLITTHEGEVFLNPAEQLVVLVPRLEVGQRVPARATLEFAAPPVWQKVTVDRPPLAIRSYQLTLEPTPRLTAVVANESLHNLTDITVAALLSDAEQNAVAVSSTLVDALAPGATKELVFTWSKAFAREVVLFDFYPHVDYSAQLQ